MWRPRLLGHVRVRRAIAEAQAERFARTAVTADRVLEELARVAFMDPAEILLVGRDGRIAVDPSRLTVESTAAIQHLEQKTDACGRSRLHIRFCDKLDALEKLGRHLGLFDRGAQGATMDVNLGPTADPEQVQREVMKLFEDAMLSVGDDPSSVH